MKFAAVVAMGVMLGCGAGAAHASQSAAEIAATMAAHPPQDLKAYYALKKQLGPDGVMDVIGEASRLATEQAGIGAGEKNFAACRFPDWYLRAYAALSFVRQVPDDASWNADLVQVDQALALRDSMHHRVRNGEAVDSRFDGAAAAFREGRAATSDRARELAMRVGEDQLARVSDQVARSKSLWATGLDAVPAQYLIDLQTADICRVDRANTEWLKTDLLAHGWPKISQYGSGLDAEAWVLVQHADHDLAFQKDVLSLLEALVPTKDTAIQNYALLYDRVALGEKRLQRYGTQGRCTGDGKWEPWPVEDAARLDARRAEAGLSSEADYTKVFTYCTAAIAAIENGQPAN